VESSKQYDLSGVHGAEVFRDLAEGLKIRLTNGSVAEITGNPHDGGFLLVKIVEDETNPSNVGDEQAVFFHEVREVVV
jgi:hypothetical protein